VKQHPVPNRQFALGLSKGLQLVATRVTRFKSRIEQSSLARHVLATRLIVLLVALTVGWQVTTQLQAAQSEQASWGISGPVLIATRSLQQGEALDHSAVRKEQIPVRFIPSGALRNLPEGRRAKVAITSGEILLRSRVSASGTGTLGATLTEQTQAVTIPLGEAPAPIQIGDIVDVVSVSTDGTSLAADSLGGSQHGAELRAQRVALSALVLRVGQGQATLAVQTKQVDALVKAAATAPISVVIVP